MDDPRSYIYLVLTFVFIFLSAFFSLVETAFSSLNKYRMKILADEGDKRAKHVMRIIDEFDFSLSSILIGNNICAVLLSIVSTYLFLKAIPSLNDSIVSIISSVVITMIVYVIGETIPKHIAKKIPNKIALKTVYPLLFFIILFFPVSLILYGISYLLSFFFNNKKEKSITTEDINSAIEINEEKGFIQNEEVSLLQNSFSFTDTKVEAVLTKAEDMFAIDMKGMSLERLAKIVSHCPYSRIPLYYEDKNKIIGILIVKTFLANYLKDKKLNILNLIQKPYVISPNIMIDNLIDGFRTTHTQIALVYKDKKLLGMVTMDDVLEELIGPICESDSGELV